MDTPRLPNSTQRLAEIGRTGSGKTVAGVYHLSRKDLREELWAIIDYKSSPNDLINNIDNARHIELSWSPPRRQSHGSGGLVIVHPLPSDAKQVNDFLWRIWERGNVGVFVDEGYMLGNMEAFEALLTQGRSMHIPMIVLTQRPSWVSRFVFSEADFFQVFDLTDNRDWITVESFMPAIEKFRSLPEHESWYYDVAKKKMFQFAPVPEPKEILSAINSQLFRRTI